MTTGLITDLSNFLISPLSRWLIFALTFAITAFSFSQEIVRFSYLKAFSGFTYNIHMFIISMIGVFGWFLTFLGLWLTIPFTDKLPDYWYMPIFLIIMAWYSQMALNTYSVKDTDDLSPPPGYILPKKYRKLIVYIILILDIIIFAQFFIYMGISDDSKKTVLHRYFTERFGGWHSGNKLAYLVSWIGAIYIINDLYSIHLQKTFRSCLYDLPKSWDF